MATITDAVGVAVGEINKKFADLQAQITALQPGAVTAATVDAQIHAIVDPLSATVTDMTGAFGTISAAFPSTTPSTGA